jgi:hypothetical protein
LEEPTTPTCSTGYGEDVEGVASIHVRKLAPQEPYYIPQGFEGIEVPVIVGVAGLKRGAYRRRGRRT